MRVLGCFFGLFLLIMACKDKQDDIQSFPETIVQAIQTDVDTLVADLKQLEVMRSRDSLQAGFSNCRSRYKSIEPFIEYYYQGLTRRINGPALPEIKIDDNQVNDPTGFQVVEEILYGDFVDHQELDREIKILITDLLFVRKTMPDMPMQAHHFRELMQHELIRIAALGITGFDSPVSLKSIEEAGYALNGIKHYYALFCSAGGGQPDLSFVKGLEASIQYTQQHNDFGEFNRLAFIKDHLMPLSEIWDRLPGSDSVQSIDLDRNKVFAGSLSDLMQGRRFNADAFSPYAESASTPEKIELGKALFQSPMLSRTNQISCASCHRADQAFTDGKVVSLRNVHRNGQNRNSPTLYYAALQRDFFYDLRSRDLENQIRDVMENPDEFNLTPTEIEGKLAKDASMVSSFKKAFVGSESITPYHIRNAIACYVRSLLPFNARIDHFFRGEQSLTPMEVNGFNLFTGKAKCATCHFIPLYNGTVPPWFNTTESEVIGVPAAAQWKQAKVDPDLGRYKLNQLEPLKYAFKTPTIRNIDRTAPYMHNGVYADLQAVIRFYELGGGNGLGMNLPHQTLPFENLQLTEQEKECLIQFMHTLTDEEKNK